MTQDQTRQLGIEFERRIQQMLPQKEYLDKMDTETIYSFLNQYLDKLVHEIFQGMDVVTKTQDVPSRVDILLKGLIATLVLTGSIGNGFDIPNSINMGMYIRSESNLTSYYRKGKSNYTISPVVYVENKLVSNMDFTKYKQAPNNDIRIMRTPVVTINNNKLEVVCDKYTTISNIKLTYYKNPRYFTPLEEGADCELPMDMFDDLVSGAVSLYIQYVAGQLKQQEKKENKED